MAYKVIILYRLYMPSYFLGTFTEYPYITCVEITEKQYYMKSGYALLQLICFMKIFCQYFLLQTELSSHYVYRLKVLKNLSDDGIA